MRIVVLPPRGVQFPSDSPWNSLLDGLRECGHEVSGFGQVTGVPDALVTLNHQPEAVQLLDRFSIQPERSALIVLEPRVTAPAMYRPRALKRYAHRFAASVMWAPSLGAKAFNWPQEIRPQRQSQTDSSGMYEATIINADKRSAVRGSLYGLRRKVIVACEEAGVPLAVFGPGWGDSRASRILQGSKAVARAILAGTQPLMSEAFCDVSIHPPFWQGISPRKDSAFAQAPVTIIIENSADYVSEKLIDAVRAGVAPIYIGPPLDLFGLPVDLAVHPKPYAPSVACTLKGLDATQRDEVVAAGQAWLNSDIAQSFEIQGILNSLGASIGNNLGRSP